MVLWIEKYRPLSLEKLTLHETLQPILQQLVEQSADLPHLLFYGPSGSGRKTRIQCILKGIFGKNIEKVKVTSKTFKSKSKTIDVSLLTSAYHIELNPSELGPTNDRLVVQEVIRDLAQTHNVNAGAQVPFKVVVLNEVDRLSLSAQHALRRTMEKYMNTCRLILVCDSLSRVIAPLRSRCLPVRVPAPPKEAIGTILNQIALKENIKISPELTAGIIEESGRNLRKAILMLENAKVKFPNLSTVAADGSSSSSSSSSTTPPVNPMSLRSDWEFLIESIAREACQEQSPQKLLAIRSKFYDLLTHCIPAEVIMRTLTDQLLKRVDDQIKHEIVQAAAQYDYNLHQGSKAIFHLEAFMARFMAIYKRWVVTTFG